LPPNGDGWKPEVVGIHTVDLVLGFGTLHCLTQQEPAEREIGSYLPV